MPNYKKPFTLVILDGWGFGKQKISNAIATANKPNINQLTQRYPMALLQASGLAVGANWGESGNSEVGHLSIGAGRIVEQYPLRISQAIKDESFFLNRALNGAYDHAQKNNSLVHVVGLLTSGTVHADFSHIIALLELARRKNFPEVYLHLFLDGKDSGLKEAPVLLKKLEEEINDIGFGKIATLIGRNYAMDRNNNWNLTKRSYELLVNAVGDKSDDIYTALENHYERGLTDTNMSPIVAAESDFYGISYGDSIIFFNFREDSIRQILKPFIERDFSFFPRKDLKNVYICTMTQYLESSIINVAFPPPEIKNGLAEVLEQNSKKQLHIAESEKYAHVTYFFNGLRAKELAGETDIFIESGEYGEWLPHMRSAEIKDKVLEELEKDIYDFFLVNFANADILSHTGNFNAVVKGIEAVDNALGLLYNRAVLQKDGIMIVTADHGNAESLVYASSGEAETRHNESPVPFYLVGREYEVKKTPERIARETREVAGILADIAPTILELMSIPQPEEMTGKSLLPVLLK